MMTGEELKGFLDLCKKVLDNDRTGYKRDKKFIREIFADAFKDNDYVEQVRRRLILIDALYSTQMSKRLYGIDELANKISMVSDKLWKEKFRECLSWEDNKWLDEGDNEPVKNLFNETYGREKESGKKKRCISLISKYAYFLCEFDFPIYDSLVIENFNNLLGAVYPNKGIDRMPQKSDVKFEVFIKCLRKLNSVSGLSYEDIDYILWTYGKLKEWNLSSIVTRDEYERFKASIKFKTDDNEEADLLIGELNGNRLIVASKIKGKDNVAKLNNLMESFKFGEKIKEFGELSNEASVIIDSRDDIDGKISPIDIRLILEAQYPRITPKMGSLVGNTRSFGLIAARDILLKICKERE